MSRKFKPNQRQKNRQVINSAKPPKVAMGFTGFGTFGPAGPARSLITGKLFEMAHPTKGASPEKKAPEKAPLCPTCSKPARLSPGKFGMKAECCGLWSWGFKPLVDRETHVARIEAHAVFDRLWKSGEMKRSVAYARLSDVMQMDRKDCHISLMTVDQAKAVVEHVRRGALSQDTREQPAGGPCDIWQTIGADCPWNPTPGIRVVQHITSLAEARRLGLR
jgi:hypothetical protein